nr:hypothetical protein [Marinicella sp. W31]MDC2875986.1 hypothetical protein [Marinicella sp. W31]
MRFYKQVAVSVCVLAIGAAAWFFLAPGGRALLTSYGVLSNEAGGGDARPSRGFAGGGIQVVTAPVETGTVNDELTAIGSGEAIRSVTVLPEEAGTIRELMILVRRYG